MEEMYRTGWRLGLKSIEEEYRTGCRLGLKSMRSTGFGVVFVLSNLSRLDIRRHVHREHW